MHLSADTLHDDGARSAAALAASGVRAGDGVALLGAPSRAYVAALVGIWQLGAVAAPLASRMPPGELPRRLAAIGARWLVTDTLGIDAEALGGAVPGVTVLPVPDLRASPMALPSAPTGTGGVFGAGPGMPALYVFTSGSSGAPKAARLSGSALVASARGVNTRVGFDAGSAWLLTLPLFHVGGVGVLVRALEAGAALVLPPPGSTIGDALASGHPTHVSLVGTQLYRLLAGGHASRLLGLVVMLGGSAIAPSLVAAAELEGVRAVTSYGLTEMGSAVTATVPGGPPADLATSGHCLDHRDLRIATPGDGNAGEIEVRGATRFDGYATAEGLRCPVDSDGWYATGDLGRLDGAGRLVVSGRRDRMFISGGENVHPEAVERLLADIPGIGEAVVVAVPDAEFGARAFAFLAPAPGTEDTFDVARLLAVAAERLPGALRPIGGARLPDTGALKPLRADLTRLAQHLRDAP